jgi:hypothetical protein
VDQVSVPEFVNGSLGHCEIRIGIDRNQGQEATVGAFHRSAARVGPSVLCLSAASGILKSPSFKAVEPLADLLAELCLDCRLQRDLSHVALLQEDITVEQLTLSGARREVRPLRGEALKSSEHFAALVR